MSSDFENESCVTSENVLRGSEASIVYISMYLFAVLLLIIAAFYFLKKNNKIKKQMQMQQQLQQQQQQQASANNKNASINLKDNIFQIAWKLRPLIIPIFAHLADTGTGCLIYILFPFFFFFFLLI